MSGTYPVTQYRMPPKSAGFQGRYQGADISGSAGDDDLIGFAQGDFIIPGATKPFDFRELLRPADPSKAKRPSAWPRRTFVRPVPPPAYEGWMPFIEEYLGPRAALKVFPGLRGISAVLGLLSLRVDPLVPAETPSPGNGWFLKCDNGQRPLNARAAGWNSATSFAGIMAAGINCGLTGQVPSGDWKVGTIYLPTPWGPDALAPWVMEELWLGPYNAAKTRFDVAVVWKWVGFRTGSKGAQAPPRRYAAYLPGTPVPMPYALVPYLSKGAYVDFGDPLPTAPRAEPSLARVPPGRTTSTLHRSPPPAGTKERKLRMTPHARSWIGLILNAVTESVDFVEAVYYAIPGVKGGRTPQEMLEIIYNRARDINVNKMIENIIVMQVIDAIQGGIGKAMTKAQRKAYVNRYLTRMHLTAGPAL